MKDAIFWYIATHNFYKNQRFEGKCHLHLQGIKSAEQEISVLADGIERQCIHLAFILN
jgi:hypothetical protein